MMSSAILHKLHHTTLKVPHGQTQAGFFLSVAFSPDNEWLLAVGDEVAVLWRAYGASVSRTQKKCARGCYKYWYSHLSLGCSHLMRDLLACFSGVPSANHAHPYGWHTTEGRSKGKPRVWCHVCTVLGLGQKLSGSKTLALIPHLLLAYLQQSHDPIECLTGLSSLALSDH